MVSSVRMNSIYLFIFVSFCSFFCTSSYAATVTAIPADLLVDSMGINTHLGYAGSLYTQNWTFTRDMLVALGIRHIREGGTTSVEREQIMELKRLGIDTQIAFPTRIRPNASDCLNIFPCIDQASYVNSLFGAIVSVEGINEPDLQKNTSSAYYYKDAVGYPNATRLYTIDTYNNWKSNPLTKNIPLGSPSIGDPRNAYLAAPLYDYYDFQTFHPYGGGNAPSQQGLQDFWINNITKLNGNNKTRPLQASECGYHTLPNNTNGDQPGVPESVQNKYLPRMWIMFYNKGIIRSYSYEFMDQRDDNPNDSQQHYGIIRYNRTPKPVYYTIQNMIRLLQDPNTKFTPGSLTYSHNGNSSVMTTLFQKSNGAFYLAIWFEVTCYNVRNGVPITVNPAPVTLNISAAVTKYNVFQISRSATVPIATGTSSVFTLTVPDEVLIIEILVSGSSTTTGPATTGSVLDCTKYKQMFDWKFSEGGDSVLAGSHENGWTATNNWVYMMTSRVVIANGNLKLSVSDEGCPKACNNLTYGTGGWISAYNYGYGEFTVKAKIPAVPGAYTVIQLFASDRRDNVILRFAAGNSSRVTAIMWANGTYVALGGNSIPLGFNYADGEFHTYKFIYSSNSVFLIGDDKPIINATVGSVAAFPTAPKMSLRVWIMAEPANTNTGYYGTWDYKGPVSVEVESVSFTSSASLPSPPAACILGNPSFGLTSANPTTTTGASITTSSPSSSSSSSTTSYTSSTTSTSTVDTTSPSVSSSTTGPLESVASPQAVVALSTLLIVALNVMW